MSDSKRRRRKSPSVEPQKISDTVWYYESRSSLLFVVECRDPQYHRTIQFKVPRKKLLESLERMGVACHAG